MAIYEAIDNIRTLYTKAGSIAAGKDKLRQRNDLLRQLRNALEEVKKKTGSWAGFYFSSSTYLHTYILTLKTIVREKIIYL